MPLDEWLKEFTKELVVLRTHLGIEFAWRLGTSEL